VATLDESDLRRLKLKRWRSALQIVIRRVAGRAHLCYDGVVVNETRCHAQTIIQG
jgi:hypothetical protein